MELYARHKAVLEVGYFNEVGVGAVRALLLCPACQLVVLKLVSLACVTCTGSHAGVLHDGIA
jgi:hypothetical protein